jgi:hypothetical protein
VKALKNYQIAPNHRLKVNIQLQNCRLFVGNIPKHYNKEQLVQVSNGWASDSVQPTFVKEQPIFRARTGRQ